MSFRAALGAIGAILFASSAAIAPARAARPEIDVSASSRPSAAVAAALERSHRDPALTRIATPAHIDQRYGVPSFVWATRSAGGSSPAPRAPGRPTPEQAARDHLSRLAPFYRLEEGDVRGATLRSVHDTGRGGIVTCFQQAVDGVEVFRDQVKVMMDRDLDLVAIAGYIPGRAEAGRAADRAFRRGAAAAIGTALEDFVGVAVDRGSIRSAGPAPGGYEWFTLGSSGRALPAGLDPDQPIRAKEVLFHLSERLVPAHYVELMTETEAAAYVVADVDGVILFRHDLMANDSYTYRVWADGTALRAPLDGPQGNGPTPHPTGLPDFYDPPFVAPTLVTLQNGPISTNDPWLPPGASETVGNNVDAYADLVSGDGLTAGDFRASTTSANTFDRTYDTSLVPGVSAAQRMASITQLFYVNNWLHDWFYDAGFDEASGNAQTSNFGRGGIQGDNLRAEAQDYNGTNNANMLTPADGGRPRMQMFVYNLSSAKVTVNSPAGIAGDKVAGGAAFGPQTFSVTADVVLVDDGSAPTGDGCSAIVNAVAGKVALIDRGTCTFVSKVLTAEAAGAVGVIIANNTAGVITMGGTGATSIPSLMVSQSDGDDIKTALLSGAVSATLIQQPALSRDGTLDNLIVAHEWGHYISNRLIGNGSGLNNTQGGGMGEGWGDFTAALVSVKEEDALVPSNPNFSGVYARGAYARSNSLTPDNAYYFGGRRYPYSTDFSKNPLTFRHIENGVPLPAGPPVAFGADGANNAEVHATGEVWCSMLWECYAELLRDPGRLTFDQARDRMREYLVAGYKMTPSSPTFLEARDAILAAASANDLADFCAFRAAFARRGAGVGAVAPDRLSTTNTGVTESFVIGDGPCTPVAVSEATPTELSLALAGAQPATGRAELRFALPEPARVRITIHDVAGRRVATVLDGEFAAGRHVATWRPVSGGSGPSSGVYFARMTANGHEITRRLIMLLR